PRPEAGMLAWLPSVAAGVVAGIAVRMLVQRAPVHVQEDSPSAGRNAGVSTSARADRPESVAHAPAPSRREFLVWAGGTAAVGVALALAGSVARAGSTAVASVRAAIRLPRAAKPAPAVPAGAALDVPGLAPLITPNDEFYRIDTALLVPSVDPADWKLRIHGMVAPEGTRTWDEQRALPMTETTVTLAG